MRTLTLWLIAGLVASGGWAQESPLRWLQRALQAEKQMQVEGVRLTQIQLGKRTEQFRERFWQRGDQQIRIEVIEPPHRQGEVFLLREGEWLRLPHQSKVAYAIPAPPFGASDLLELGIELLKKEILSVQQLPDERVANRPCVVLTLQLNTPPRGRPIVPPNRPGPPERVEARFPFRVTIWIDRETGLILKREIATRPGVVNLRTEIVRLNLNPTFTRGLFQLPEGVTIYRRWEQGFDSLEEAQRRAGFPIRVPSYLPENAERVRLMVNQRGPRGAVMVMLQYRCSQGRFTLFQTYKPAVGFRPPRNLRSHHNALFWQDRDYWFGLVGDLPMAEMERIAESLGYRHP